jgi:uncharacterized protein (TIGR03790 family)
MPPPIRLRVFRLFASALLLGTWNPLQAAQPTQAAPTNAVPPPPLFLAPPPLTSTTPEAPPIVDHPTPNIESETRLLETPSRAVTPATRPPPPPRDAAPILAPHPIEVTIPIPERFLHPEGDPDHLADHLLVAYNANDPQSESLARYYAQRRQIPAERVLALFCPLREEITRAEFERTIRRPIVDDLLQHHWLERRPDTLLVAGKSLHLLAATRNDIWSIVLMRGVPLKIAASPTPQPGLESQPELKTDAAAVDSELALLPVEGLPLGGFVPNPFFDVNNSGLVRVGPELARRVVLVTRLDGPTASDVRRMIDDCLAAEKERLAGQAVIDSRGFTDPANGYTEGDVWLRTARDLLADEGWPVVFDNHPDTLAATEPLDQVALYLGWYTPAANGPWVTPPERFVPGAIAYHLHSFSAWTVRSTTQNWVGPLIDHGADATMGNVYEPYLVLTPHLDIFTRRLLDGDSFAEAAYACQLGLSWMTTVVGDPLYQPFQKPIEEAIAAAPPGPHREWLVLEQIERQLDDHPPASAAALETAFNVPDAGPILQEHLGDLMQKLSDPAAPADEEKAYLAALRQSSEPIDCIRIGLKLARAYESRNEELRAQAQLQALRDAYPIDALRFGVPRAAGSSDSPPETRSATQSGRSATGEVP